MDRCSSCDIELTDGGLMAGGQVYCCAGCADSGPCTCSYDGAHARPSNGHADPVMTWALLGSVESPEDEKRGRPRG